MPEYYEIRIKGHLNPGWTTWFSGLEVTHLVGDETLLAGPLPDQAALHGMLERIRDLNLTLISVSQGRPSSQLSNRRVNMKTMVISYSLSGNNEALATRIATALEAEHVRITESKRRTTGTIIFDMIFKRTPKTVMPVADVKAYDWVLFVGPVWMGQIATPFRGCFQQLAPQIGNYGYLSISGGAEGPNPKLADELTARLGKEPDCLIDLHIADLLPTEPEPTRQDTMRYRITDREAQALTDTAIATLQATMAN